MVNFPPEALAERIWAMPSSHGAERITRSGLSLLRAPRGDAAADRRVQGPPGMQA